MSALLALPLLFFPTTGAFTYLSDVTPRRGNQTSTFGLSLLGVQASTFIESPPSAAIVKGTARRRKDGISVYSEVPLCVPASAPDEPGEEQRYIKA